MKTFLTRHRLTLVDVRDFVVIVLFIGTMMLWAALAGGAIKVKTFLTRHRLTLVDVRDFVVIVIFIGTLMIWAAIAGGA